MKDYIRQKLVPYKQVLHPNIDDINLAGEGQPFFLTLLGDNADDLITVSEKLMKKFESIPGLVDLDVNYRSGKPELQVQMNSNKMVKLGVQSATAGMELRGMVEGIIPAKYKESGTEYDIRVRLQNGQRDLSTEFDSLYVPNVNYQLVKLKNIADPVQTTGPSKIYRKNRSRYIAITGNLGKHGAVQNITVAAEKILKTEQLPPGVSYEFAGASENYADMFKNMMIAAVLSVVFIYFVLASLYESLVIPLAIMLALPLAIIGALIALFITGKSIDILTMIGFVMLLGLVTKNSILLIDYAQQLMQRGLSIGDAITHAGLPRLRPILITTFALIAGMLPVALALTEVSLFRQTMGIAVIGGLISSTFLTLLVIPAVFEYMYRFQMWSRSKFGRPTK
jgi:multidrug efflux pump subunit AcrB